MEEKSERENRIRAITKLYYSNPKVQECLVEFAKNREVVPRYFENFGKRPDSLIYSSDISSLVKKGATSFHASEELWEDPLKLSSDMSIEELNALRLSWDLLIDIDSPYLDLSKIAAKLILEELELHGVSNYGLKYSGSKGFHIIVSGKAFPKEYDGKLMKESFPEWPRAITEYLFWKIRKKYNVEAGKIMSFSKVEKERVEKAECLKCGREAKKGNLMRFKCSVCGMTLDKREEKGSRKKIKCLNKDCPGFLEFLEKVDYFYCEYCKDSENPKIPMNSYKNPENFEILQGEDAGRYGKLDLVLVAPRHLFRMPYSLHEKTSLASVVLLKEEIDKFSPRDADPLRVSIRKFLPDCLEGEAKKLLVAALAWKKTRQEQEKVVEVQSFAKKINITNEGALKNIKEEDYPEAIKKLLMGLSDGKKRGLFILITFLRALGKSPEEITARVYEWNKKNNPPLKEGYIKSQLQWHFKQKKKILPPNYENESFYYDLGLIEKKPNAKNPLSDVLRNIKNHDKKD